MSRVAASAAEIDALLLRVPGLMEMGVVFDMHSGEKKQAPAWIREHGLEWFFRFLQELKRLWRRYILCGSELVFWIALEILGLGRFA